MPYEEKKKIAKDHKQVNRHLKKYDIPLRLVCLKEGADYYFTPTTKTDSEFFKAYQSLNTQHYKRIGETLDRWRMRAACLAAYIRNTDPDSYQEPIERRCRNCHDIKPMDDYSVSFTRGGKRYWYGDCKQCRSDIQNQKYSIQRAEKNPGCYFQCDECSHVQVKFLNNHNGETRSECVKCGSKELYDFV